MKTILLGLLAGVATCSFSFFSSGPAATAAGPADGNELQGKFLVAQPQVNDPRFSRSIILIIDHNSDGAMGLVLNKMMAELSSAEILESLQLDPLDAERSLKIFFGGPVELNRGFILHSTDYDVETSRKIAEKVAFSADAATVRLLVSGEGPKRFLIAFGYAGWGPGQLETELERGDWRIMPLDAEVIFTSEPEKSWDLLMGDQVFHL